MPEIFFQNANLTMIVVFLAVFYLAFYRSPTEKDRVTRMNQTGKETKTAHSVGESP